MVWFEVFIPAKDAGLPNITLTVEAPNWIGALRTGLSNLGEGHEAIANVMCDIKEDNSIHVTDVSTRRVFRLREVPAPSSAQAPPPASSLPPEMTKPMPPAPRPEVKTSPGQPRPVSMPEIPRDALDDRGLDAPLDDATIPNPIAVLPDPSGQMGAEHSVPWTKMASPQQDVVSPTIELKASMPPPASVQSMAAPAKTQQMFKAQVLPAPDAKTVPSQPVPKPPLDATEEAPPPSQEKKKAAPASSSAAETRPVEKPTFQEPAKTAQETPKKKKAPPEPAEPTERLPRAPAASPTSQEKKTGPLSAPTPRGTPAPPPKRTTGQFEAAPKPITRETSMPVPQAAPIGRSEPAVNPQAIADAVADVFDATQDLLMEESVAPKDIAERLLDIALSHVPAESGSFYLADVNGHDLNFAAVRGPKASEIQKKKLSVKIGQGIVGFCALEGVCLSVSDIQKDPRYFSAISDAVGYSPKDTLCASAEKDGRLFGALQLINSRGGFTPVHMEVLRYIGLTAASLLERHFDTQ